MLAWMVSGQPFAGIVDYLTAGFEVAVHYVDAMTNWESEVFDMAAVLCAAATILLIPLSSYVRVRGEGLLQSVVYPMTFATLLFLIFKATLIGFHGHKLPIYFGSLFLIALYSMLATQGRPDYGQRRHRISVAVTGGLFVVVLVSAYVRYVETDHSPAALVALGNPQHPAAAASWLAGDNWMQQRYQECFDEIRRRHRLPKIDGTIDVVPDKLAMAIANDQAEFRPRPVMHSYSTYSAWLADQNAAHYRSRGPDFVLFRVNPILERFPTLNDGKLWLELIRGYDVRDSVNSDLLLCRRGSERHVELRPVATVRTAWNQWVELPESVFGPIWCRVKVSQTPAGKLAAFAYKLPELRLDVMRRDVTDSYRFTSGSGESGFLLSPVLSNRKQLAALLTATTPVFETEELTKARVDGIRFRTSEVSESYFHEQVISVTFEEVLISDDSRLAAAN